MRAYYASKISSNISETPEGYLICRNAPIARTGQQKYFRHELGFTDRPNEEVVVNRRSEDVFSPQTLASFEGKPVTDDHPYGDQVTSENASVLLKGVATNVRQGEGDDADKLIADLIVYDKLLADEIRSGKRELSCGYDSLIVEGDDGQLYQTTIRGNHIAVVEAGRAGSDVRIKDQKPAKQTIIRRKTPMAKKKTDPGSIFARLTAAFFSDAEPEEKTEILEEVGQALLGQDEVPTEPASKADSASAAAPAAADNAPPAGTGGGDATLPVLLEAVKALTDTVNSIKDEVAEIKAGGSTADQDPLAVLEQEIVKELADQGEDVAGEEDFIVNPEQVDEDGTQTADEGTAAATTTTADIDPTTDEAAAGVPTADKKALLSYVRTMKPLIAGVKDKAQKKALVDGLNAFVRSSLHQTPTKQQGGYTKMANVRSNALKQRANDAKHTQNAAAKDAATAQAAYDSRNPHKKKGA